MKVLFRKSFARDLKTIHDQVLLNRIQQVIEGVESASRLQEIGNLQKISGSANFFRIRVGEYRIGVIVVGDIVEFVRCLPRRDMYRYFP